MIHSRSPIVALGPLLAKRVSNRWPAIILAAKRTDKVKGRIIVLISSIITIKGINAAGVPRGTRWANMEEGVLTEANIMWPNHRGRAKAIVKLKCLEEVNT